MSRDELPRARSVNWVAVASLDGMKTEDMIPVRAGKVQVALFRVDDRFYATDNLCTHADAALTDGWMDGCIVECPLHGGRFDVTTGKGLGPPIDCDLKTYDVRVVDTEIQILVDCALADTR